MAEKIKKFFSKKKADAKFKLAGPGHKLTEDTTKPQSSQSKTINKPVAPMTEERKLAAQAALLRLDQKRESPSFNTSLAAIQAQVKKELEREQQEVNQSISKESESPPKPTQAEVPQHLAATGVYFKCPMISNDILPRDEWKRNIKTFLYEQLCEERGLTACLIIQSCNSIREKIDACVETLCKYLENIVSHPDEEKFQKIRMSNRVFCDKVQPLEGALDLLLAAGFRQEKLPNPDGVDEDFLVFHSEDESSIDGLTSLIDALRSAEPIPLELDRNLQVLLPSQAARKMDLPAAFYALSMDEIKKEHALRLEAAEKSQMLRTKAMRERDELREMRKYKFALVRVRFPDGILLQGTFSVYERFIDIHQFVSENLDFDLPFILNSPNGEKLTPETDGDKNLIDLRLVPAAILAFGWDPSFSAEIANSPNKDVYLKPEVMVMVQEM